MVVLKQYLTRFHSVPSILMQGNNDHMQDTCHVAQKITGRHLV